MFQHNQKKLEVVCRRQNKGDESERSKSISKLVLILELSKLWFQHRPPTCESFTQVYRSVDTHHRADG